MTKFEQLEDYINQANEILESNDTAKAERYCQRVIAVFSNEIQYLEYKLDATSSEPYTEDRPIDYMGDLEILKEKLINYQIELQEKAANITLDKLQSSELSESERNEIENMVRELIQKSKAGEPSKNVASKIFSWLADKGGDALVQMIALIASGALLRG